ncbi:5-formyltetrahydrofolate cyclo-ligase [Acidothermaceae bacterium B102]|nr:5-formyltetrahydrofolate cyclo-ligase [Acidothermaceae bacterium B102]
MDPERHSPNEVTPDVRDRKAALRATLGRARAQRSADQLLAAGAALAGWADALDAPAVVAAYIGIDSEPPTIALLEALEARGVRILLPVVRPGSALDWSDAPVGSATRAGPLGLLEPTGPLLGTDAVRAAGLVLVPALAVDRTGGRLGRGGGYYDRALAAMPRAARRVAMVFDDELLDEVPVEAHDQGVDGALTPAGLVMFRT